MPLTPDFTCKARTTLGSARYFSIAVSPPHYIAYKVQKARERGDEDDDNSDNIE